MGHMSIHQARRLGQHIHGDTHHRRAPAPEPEPEAAAHAGLEAATNIKIPAPDRAALAPRSTETANAEKPVTTSTFTMPIALGIVIPVVAAAIWFIYLHRRHVKKQREEDANDRHKSLDFGMGDVPGGGTKGASSTIRDMANAEKGISPTSRSARQKSMDMNLESPYLLPPEIQNSRESLHSLSKTIHQEADPYRPVTQFTHSDAASVRSFPRDNASTYTRSSAAPSRNHENADLLGHAASIGRSDPPLPGHFPQRQNSLPQDSPSASPIEEPRTLSPLNQNAPNIQNKDLPSSLRPGSMLMPTSPLSAIENLAAPAPIPTIKMPEEPEEPEEPALPTPGPTLQQTPNRKPAPTLPGIVNMPPEPEDHLPVDEPVRESVLSEISDYGDAFQITPPSPTQEQKRSSRYSMDVPPEEFAKAGLGAPGFDPKRLSMGFRPLPPDALDAAEDPEARANRIRSFYKEYFDDTKPAPAGQYYGEDENYLGDAAYFDPDSKNFVMPYAEPVTRRAMTPPPRGPRFMGPPRAMHDSMGGGPMRSQSPGPRSQSSASQRGPGGPHGPPRKPLPPPSPLSTLPTPSQLGDDSFAIMGAMDFAPPTTFRDRQAGIRPESPMGERRPYSPHVPAATPLVSTFDELAAIPSPHMLRKSGTFTSLDFAAPRKFRDPEAPASDAGSIRSNRSGVSQMQQAAIRNGAYRVSRLPQDMVFSKDDLSASLKPTWGMRQGTTPHPSQTHAPGSMPGTPK